MAIQRVEIKDYLVFKGDFTAEFCPGVNVIIGGNGTGKTTLLRAMYDGDTILNDATPYYDDIGITNFVYIPEKDILEHASGLLTFIVHKQTGFGRVYEDLLLAAQDVATKVQSETQLSIRKKVASVIDGEVFREPADGSFYTLKTDGSRVYFDREASGYKRLGYLGLLVRCGQLEPGSVLFWDEPENSLNPNHISVLADILLELARSGVQVIIATHSELLARYLAVNRQKGDIVKFMSLYKDGEQIKSDDDERFDLLEPNNLMSEPVRVYKREIEKGLGGNG